MGRIKMSSHYCYEKPLTIFFAKVACLLVLPVESFSNTHYPVGTEIIFIPLVLCWVCETLKRGRVFFPLESIVVCSIIFLIVTGSIIHGAAGGSNVKDYIRLAFLFVFYLIVVDVGHRPAVAGSLVRCYLFGVIYLCVTALLNIVSGETWMGLMARYSASGMDPNNFALILCSILPVLYYFMFYRAGLVVAGIVSVACSIILTALFGFFVIQTASRAGLALYAIDVLLLFGLLGSANSRASKWFLIYITAAMSYVLYRFLYYGLDVSLRVLDRLGGVGNDARFEYWGKLLEMFAAYPMFGIGLGAGLSILGVEPHSVVIVYLVELGVVFFLLFLLFISIPLFRVCRADVGRFRKLLVVAVSLVLLVGVSTLNWWDRTSMFFILAIVSCLSFIESAGSRKFNV